MKGLLLCLLFSATLTIPALAQEANEPIVFKTDGIRYQVNAENNATVSLMPIDDGYQGDFVLPAQVTDESTGTTYTVTGIGNEAFYRSKCDKITLPATLTSIAGNAFFYCTMKEFVVDAASTAYTALDGILYTKDMSAILSFPNSKDFGNYQLPETVTSIGDYAFCSVWLTQFDIPEQITSIGEGAFMDTRLRSFEIPATVKNIGSAVLQNCRSLKTVSFPEGMTVLPDHILASSYMLEKVDLPSTLTRIGTYAFSGTFIYSYGSLVQEIVIPDNVTTIESGAFDGCRGLKTVTLNKNLQTIDLFAFTRCSALTKLISLNPEPPKCLGMVEEENDVEGAFNEVPASCVLYVPENSVESYRTAWGSKFTDIRPLETSGIDNITPNGSDMHVSTADGVLTVSAASPVEVFDTTGKKLASSASGSFSTPLTPGVYIVRAGLRSMKVVVR